MSRPAGENRRRTPRVRAANLVNYSTRDATGVYAVLGSATTVDISETGLRLRTKESLLLGAILDLELKLGGEVFKLEGRIVWGEEVEPDARYDFGVRFTSVPQRALETLRVFVSVKRVPEE